MDWFLYDNGVRNEKVKDAFLLPSYSDLNWQVSF